MGGGAKFLKNSENVVLNFPFKDCVLQGSCDKDDAKTKEFFLNDIISKDEIDVLFDKKVLCDFKKFGDDEKNLQDTLKSDKINLILKGNNLLALHTLKSNFGGKVKLIYIDPPYNTGNDSFNYNDNFNHSTWLTFMKNRLEIAREFLRDDGVIFIQCDDNEQAYLKVLMDEIFGRENFVSCAIWNSISSVLKQSKFIRKEHEYILIYAKNKINLTFYKLANSMKFINPDNDPNGAWFSSNAASPNQKSQTNFFGIKLPNGEICERNWKFTYSEFINGEVSLYFKDGNVPRLKIYEKYYNKNTTTQSSIFVDLGSITTAKTELKFIFNTDLFDTPKPESLIKRIIEISTQPNDIVMDFFLGSATTAAVAHKMNRQYIGIEQMDYIESVSVERLKKVIEGEQGGISKTLNWQGGGSFIYAKLMPLNMYFKEAILNADENKFSQIYEKLQKIAFIDFRIDLQKLLKDNEFINLSLDDKKSVLIECLDKNMDYVLLSDINDEIYDIDENTKVLNKAFYGQNDE